MAVCTLLVLVILCVAGQGSGNGECPRRFDFRYAKGRETENESVFVPSCYLITTTQKTWMGAKKHCNCLGGDLITLETHAELDHIAAVIRNNSALQRPGLVPFDFWGFWTSGNDLGEENTWLWGTNKRIDPDDSRWSKDNPDNRHYDEHCMIMVPDENFVWHDIACHNEFISYICEIDAKR